MFAEGVVILIAKRNFRIGAPVSNRLIGLCSGGKAGLETGAPIKRRSFRELLLATVLNQKSNSLSSRGTSEERVGERSFSAQSARQTKHIRCAPPLPGPLLHFPNGGEGENASNAQHRMKGDLAEQRRGEPGWNGFLNWNLCSSVSIRG